MGEDSSKDSIANILQSRGLKEAIEMQTSEIPRQTFFTVGQFATAEPAFTAAALRNLIFKATPRHSSKGEIRGNGLIESGAIVRSGKKVLIHRECFLQWVRK